MTQPLASERWAAGAATALNSETDATLRRSQTGDPPRTAVSSGFGSTGRRACCGNRYARAATAPEGSLDGADALSLAFPFTFWPGLRMSMPPLKYAPSSMLMRWATTSPVKNLRRGCRRDRGGHVAAHLAEHHDLARRDVSRDHTITAHGYTVAGQVDRTFHAAVDIQRLEPVTSPLMTSDLPSVACSWVLRGAAAGRGALERLSRRGKSAVAAQGSVPGRVRVHW